MALAARANAVIDELKGPEQKEKDKLIAQLRPEVEKPGNIENGHKLFLANCAGCHGARGAGDGPVAGGLAPQPTNFHLKKPDRERALEVLANGLPGTAMPPWKSQLSVDQRHALAEFVRSLYGPPQEISRE